MQYPEQWLKLFERFKTFFPCYAEDVVYWQPDGPGQILCVMSDRGKILYDDNTRMAYCMRYREDVDNEEVYRRDFGYRLYALMNNKGISQKTLSELTGISARMLSNYIHGVSSPSHYNVVKLARVLGCSPNQLTYSYDDMLEGVDI